MAGNAVQAYDPTTLELKRWSKTPPRKGQITLSHEIWWRTWRIAADLGVAPGLLIESLIGPTVLGPKAPYDTYGRAHLRRITGSAGAMESQGIEGEQTGSETESGDTQAIPADDGAPALAGAGEGSRKGPAPSKKGRKAG